jgi:hypothetical protein
MQRLSTIKNEFSSHANLIIIKFSEVSVCEKFIILFSSTNTLTRVEIFLFLSDVYYLFHSILFLEQENNYIFFILTSFSWYFRIDEWFP